MLVKLEKQIAEQWARGLPPSQIDRALKLGAGVSRSIIVSLWAADKAGCEDAPLARRDFLQRSTDVQQRAPELAARTPAA